MRDPFDTGPVLRLGDAPAKASEPEDKGIPCMEVDQSAPGQPSGSPCLFGYADVGAPDRLQVDTSNLTKVTVEPTNPFPPATVTVADLATAIKAVFDRNGVDPLTPDQIAILAMNVFSEIQTPPLPELFDGQWTVEPDPRPMTQDERDHRWSHPMRLSRPQTVPVIPNARYITHEDGCIEIEEDPKP